MKLVIREVSGILLWALMLAAVSPQAARAQESQSGYQRVGVDYAAVFNQFFLGAPGQFSGNTELGMSHRVSGSYNF